MGMDVYGLKPKNEKGSYFRNNVWWWRPLWNYCGSVDPTLFERVPGGHYNSGDGLKTPEEAEALGFLLLKKIDSGAVKKAEADYNTEKANLPMEKCELCESTGIRKDSVGVEMGMPEKELDESVAIVVGRSKGWCNACNGLGERPSFATSYDFTEDNVKEFALFLISCGGFEIW